MRAKILQPGEFVSSSVRILVDGVIGLRVRVVVVGAEGLEKTELALRTAFPTELNAKLVLELVQMGGNHDHG